LNDDEIKPGEYDVFVNVSYLTGYTTKETTLFISPMEALIIPGEVISEEAYIPIWVFFIPVILLFSYFIYIRKGSNVL
ncbi:MAG: hypothetical protein JSW41_05240, partial [Candidatus Aenigmatarchaeota archaeon]